MAESDRQPCAILDDLSKGYVSPPDVLREESDAGVIVDEAWNHNANRPRILRAFEQLAPTQASAT